MPSGFDGLASNSFNSYEGIRILIPGGLVLVAYTGIARTFELNAPLTTNNILTSAVVSLVAGLVLYFLDIPSKSAFYSRYLPSDVLKEFDVTPPPKVSLANAYFVLFDEKFPSSIHDRSLYAGSMYRIGYESISILTVSILTALTLELGLNPTGSGNSAAKTVLLVGCLICVTAIPAAYMFQRSSARRRTRRQATTSDYELPAGSDSGEGDQTQNILARWRASRIRTELPLMDRLAIGLLLAVAIVGSLSSWLPRPFIFAPSLVLAGFFFIRFHRGHPDSERTRRSQSPFANSIPLALSLAAAFAMAALDGSGPTAFSGPTAAAWVALAVVNLSLVISRGYERRFAASFATQAAWMRINRESIKTAIEVDPEVASLGANDDSSPDSNGPNQV